MTTTTPQLTEAQRSKRRQQARQAIEAVLRETVHEWATSEGPDFALMSDIAMDALGETAAEILVDGTMMRSLTVKNGVTTLELEEATEIIKIFVASMRGVLDGYGAENYVEMDMQVVKAEDRSSVSMDVQDGANPTDSYTVTVQRRYRPTPHEFRKRAEGERDTVLNIVGRWAYDHGATSSVDVCALLQLLSEAGVTVPGGEGA